MDMVYRYFYSFTPTPTPTPTSTPLPPRFQKKLYPYFIEHGTIIPVISSTFGFEGPSRDMFSVIPSMWIFVQHEICCLLVIYFTLELEIV
jgi:hypothetical protein